jgi:iron complex outermembrane recepter protein
MKQTSRFTRHLFLFLSASAAVGSFGSRLLAAEAKTTELAPFKVEAEFGVDGLRIQNSSSVLNAYLLDQHGVAQMQDISGIAPNLFNSNSDSRGFGDILALRGAANSIFFGAPAVALYIDGVPSGSVASYPSTLLNIESLVVKSGPQGTDYGRNAPGGIIDITSRVPGVAHQGKLQVEYGNFDTKGVQAAFDGPLGEKAGYSLGLGYLDREGYIDNTFLRRSADDRRSFAGRGAVVWKPGKDAQIRFGALIEKIDDDAVRLTSLFSPDRYQVASDLNGETEIDRSQYSVQFRKKISAGTFIYSTARQKWEVDPAITDLDLSPLPLASSTVRQSELLWTKELRFESTPTAERAQWRAGLFYSNSNIDGDALRNFIVPPSAFVPPNFFVSERTIFDIDQKTLAAYANADQPLSRATMLKAGVRLEKTESSIARTKRSANSLSLPFPQDVFLNLDQEDVYFSATAGLVHALSDSLNLQGRTSLGKKPAGYSAFTANPALAHFNDEDSWANEVGVTFGPPKGRFAGSVMGFWNRIRGYQFERTVPGSTDFVVVNANQVVSRGAEAKFMWNPAERVWWDFSAGYTDATFDDHRDANGARVNGKHVPYIPEFTLRTGVTVDFGGGFSGNASYAGIGRAFYDERNTTMFSQKSYGIVNAQLRYRVQRCTVTLYGQNLFEEDYYQFINPEIFAGSPGAPRRFGVQLSFEY